MGGSKSKMAAAKLRLLLLCSLAASCLAEAGDNCSLTNRPPRKVRCRHTIHPVGLESLARA